MPLLRNKSLMMQITLVVGPVLCLLSIGGFLLVSGNYVQRSFDDSKQLLKAETEDLSTSLDHQIGEAAWRLLYFVNQQKGKTDRISIKDAFSAMHKKIGLDNFSGYVEDGKLKFVGRAPALMSGESVRDQATFSLLGDAIKTTGVSSTMFGVVYVWFRYEMPLGAGASVEAWTLMGFNALKRKIEELTRKYPDLVLALRSNAAKGERFSLLDEDTAQGVAKLSELHPAQSFETVTLKGDLHLAYKAPLKRLPFDIILAPPRAEVFSSRDFAIVCGFVGLVFSLFAAGFLVRRLLQRHSSFIGELSDRQLALVDSKGDSARDPSKLLEISSREDQTLNVSMDALTEKFLDQKFVSEVVDRTLVELFSCATVKDLIVKVIEVLAVKCHAETSWFEPFVAEMTLSRDPLSDGGEITGWIWRNHRIAELDAADSFALQRDMNGKNSMVFGIKIGIESLGSIRVFASGGFSDRDRKAAEAVVALLEKMLSRHELLKRRLIKTLEANVARMMQKSVNLEGVDTGSDPRRSQFYVPSNQLGGDVFCHLPMPNADRCYLVMAHVAGDGIAQGLSSAGIKGSLDVVSNLMSSRESHLEIVPRQILQLLRGVMNGLKSTINGDFTCMIADVDFQNRKIRVANQNYPYPYLMRRVGENLKIQRINVFAKPVIDEGVACLELPLLEDDFVVALSDGLSNAKGFKSEVFERFMANSVERSDGYKSAGEMRNDLQKMYEYYTSGRQPTDDVFFFVMHIIDRMSSIKSA